MPWVVILRILPNWKLWKSSLPSEDGEALHTVGHLAHPAALSDSAAGWFALYTTARHEKRVADHLGQREIEHYLPLYLAQHKWRDGSRVTLDLPLFPSYLFVRVQRHERVRVLEVPGALTMVLGTGGQPAALPDALIQTLRSGLAAAAVEPHPLLVGGQRVRICAGAFTGLEGVVLRSKSRCRVVLTLDHIMRSFSVELPTTDLEAIADSATVPGMSSKNLA